MLRLMSTCAAALAAVLAAGVTASASAASTVTVGTVPSGLAGAPGTELTTAQVAVDAAGTAHFAWIDPDQQHIDVCEIPAGASACQNRRSLSTNPLTVPDGYQGIWYYKNGYAPTVHGVQTDGVWLFLDSSGQPIVAASVGSLFTGSLNPSFLFGLEVFTAGPSGQWSGPRLVGSVAPLPNKDSLLLEPDYSGFDELGYRNDTDANAGTPYYDLAPFTSGAPERLYPAPANAYAITKLPNGETALLGLPQLGANGLSSLGLSLQAPDLGSFGPWQNLGITFEGHPVFSATGGSYVLGIQPAHLAGIGLLLYRFSGARLLRPVPIGSEVPDTFEATPRPFVDGTGAVHVVWEAPCPTLCLDYRELLGGDRLSSTTVLRRLGSTSITTETIDDIVVATDANGDGWAVTADAGPNGTDRLVAQRLFIAPQATLAGATVTLTGPAGPLVARTASFSLAASGRGGRGLTQVAFSLSTPFAPAESAAIARAATVQRTVLRRGPFRVTFRLPHRPGGSDCARAYHETLTATAYAGRRRKTLAYPFTWCPA